MRKYRKVSSIEEQTDLSCILITKEEEVFKKHFVDYFKPRNLQRLYKRGDLCLYLSHFHRDHTLSLGPNWRRRNIFTTRKNAFLISKLLGVESKLIQVFKFNEPIFTNRRDGVQVFPLKSNHILGSSMFLFQKAEKTILHTTDFRFDHELQQTLSKNIIKIIGRNRIDHVLLDCTNTHHQHHIPSREEASEVLSSLIRNLKEQITNVKFFILCYNAGKDVLVDTLINDFGRIGCFKKRFDTMRVVFGDSYVQDHLTHELCDVNLVDVTTWKKCIHRNRDYTSVFVRASCFSTSSYTFKKLSKKKFIVNIPYTDHSSSYELKKFLSNLLIPYDRVTCMFSRFHNPIERIQNARDYKSNCHLFLDLIKSVDKVRVSGERMKEGGF